MKKIELAELPAREISEIRRPRESLTALWNEKDLFECEVYDKTIYDPLSFNMQLYSNYYIFEFDSMNFVSVSWIPRFTSHPFQFTLTHYHMFSNFSFNHTKSHKSHPCTVFYFCD